MEGVAWRASLPAIRANVSIKLSALAVRILLNANGMRFHNLGTLESIRSFDPADWRQCWTFRVRF